VSATWTEGWIISFDLDHDGILTKDDYVTGAATQWNWTDNCDDNGYCYGPTSNFENRFMNGTEKTDFTAADLSWNPEAFYFAQSVYANHTNATAGGVPVSFFENECDVDMEPYVYTPWVPPTFTTMCDM
jgi:outer membrane receptor protein involved in Fe transport